MALCAQRFRVPKDLPTFIPYEGPPVSKKTKRLCEGKQRNGRTKQQLDRHATLSHADGDDDGFVHIKDFEDMLCLDAAGYDAASPSQHVTTGFDPKQGNWGKGAASLRGGGQDEGTVEPVPTDGENRSLAQRQATKNGSRDNPIELDSDQAEADTEAEIDEDDCGESRTLYGADADGDEDDDHHHHLLLDDDDDLPSISTLLRCSHKRVGRSDKQIGGHTDSQGNGQPVSHPDSHPDSHDVKEAAPTRKSDTDCATTESPSADEEAYKSGVGDAMTERGRHIRTIEADCNYEGNDGPGDNGDVVQQPKLSEAVDRMGSPSPSFSSTSQKRRRSGSSASGSDCYDTSTPPPSAVARNSTPRNKRRRVASPSSTISTTDCLSKAIPRSSIISHGTTATKCGNGLEDGAGDDRCTAVSTSKTCRPNDAEVGNKNLDRGGERLDNSSDENPDGGNEQEHGNNGQPHLGAMARACELRVHKPSTRPDNRRGIDAATHVRARMAETTDPYDSDDEDEPPPSLGSRSRLIKPFPNAKSNPRKDRFRAEQGFSHVSGARAGEGCRRTSEGHKPCRPLPQKRTHNRRDGKARRAVSKPVQKIRPVHDRSNLKSHEKSRSGRESGRRNSNQPRIASGPVNRPLSVSGEKEKFASTLTKSPGPPVTAVDVTFHPLSQQESILIVTGGGDKAPIGYHGRVASAVESAVGYTLTIQNVLIKPLEHGYWVLTGVVCNPDGMHSHNGQGKIQAPQRSAPSRPVHSFHRDGKAGRSRGNCVDDGGIDNDASSPSDSSNSSHIDQPSLLSPSSVDEESDGLGEDDWRSTHIKKTPWATSEDEHLRKWVAVPKPNWKAIFRRFPKRTDVSVRQRGSQLRSNVDHQEKCVDDQSTRGIKSGPGRSSEVPKAVARQDESELIICRPRKDPSAAAKQVEPLPPLSKIKLSKPNYIVEAILDSTKDAQFGCRYLVKWEGYSDLCWELPTTICVTPQAIEFHELNPTKPKPTSELS